MSDLTGTVAVVTGGSRGYGAGIARRLAEAGADVTITGRDEKALSATAKRLGVAPIVADVSSGKDWDRIFETVLKAHDRIDVLVNNAGSGGNIGPLDQQSDDDIAGCIATNLTGTLLGCRRAAEVMKRQRGGTIINVASVCADVAWGQWSVYSAAKAGLVQFSKCLYLELRSANVRVTTLNPSWGATQFTDAAGLGPRDPQTAARCIQPEELGDQVVLICALPKHLVIQDVTIWPLVQELPSM